jgi:hypothetical protein
MGPGDKAASGYGLTCRTAGAWSTSDRWVGATLTSPAAENLQAEKNGESFDHASSDALCSHGNVPVARLKMNATAFTTAQRAARPMMAEAQIQAPRACLVSLGEGSDFRAADDPSAERCA